MTTLYDVQLYTKSDNSHFVRIDDENLAILEDNLATDKSEHFAQVYCYDGDCLVNIRMSDVELYTVKAVTE